MSECSSGKILDPSIRNLSIAAQALKDDNPVVFPTDTVYGIGAKMTAFSAIEEIYRLKKRNTNKLLPILVPSIDFLSEIINDTLIKSECLKGVISEFWPGPLTIVLKKNKSFYHPFYKDNPYIAVRNPDHFVPKILMEYIKAPLVCSSANISGSLPLSNVEAIVNVFPHLKVVVDGGELLHREVSTVIKLFPHFEILREGKIKKEELLKFLHNRDLIN